MIERVADHAPPAEVGDRQPQLVPAGPDRVVEVEPAHAGLDDRIRALLVDLEHAIHVAEADDDRSAHAWRRAAVAVVAALTMRPERAPGARSRPAGPPGSPRPSSASRRPRRCSRPSSRGRTDRGTPRARASEVSTAAGAERSDEPVEGGRERLLATARAGARCSRATSRTGSAMRALQIIARTSDSRSSFGDGASDAALGHADHAVDWSARAGLVALALSPPPARRRRRRLGARPAGSRCDVKVRDFTIKAPGGSLAAGNVDAPGAQPRARHPRAAPACATTAAAAAAPRRPDRRRGRARAAHRRHARGRPPGHRPRVDACTSRPAATSCSATCPATTSAACTTQLVVR